MSLRLSMMSYTLARGEWGKRRDIPELCRFAVELGMDAVDWVSTYGKEPAELRRVTDDHGLRTVCHTFNAPLHAIDAEIRRQAADAVKRGLEAAAVLGAPRVMIVVSGQKGTPRAVSREWALEGLAAAVQAAAPLGITVTIEPFPGEQSPFVTTADLRLALRAVPGLKFTYDNGNLVTGGDDPAAAFSELHEHFVHAHFKDWSVVPEGLRGLDGRCYRGALVGEGIVAPAPCLAAMRRAGYAGHVNFEYEGNAYDPFEATRRGVKLLRELWGAQSTT
ncbi:MAG TPA: sugar phosphate isomerase/epimerase family protein [Limnochordia bacterium]|nr:sugar phosphate isomerase/epimerase family protein [Limnochordia bacterium]